jgi:ubiquitin-activating enzyme E1
MIRSITNEESAVVTLLEGSKHPYEDGEYVVIDLVEGMNVEGQATEFVQTEQQKFYDEMTGSTSQAKSQKSINGRVFKITTINANSFRIGDTRSLSKYIRNGIARNIKLPKKINFKPFRECFKNPKELPFDNNLQIYDFEKMSTNSIVSVCFDILSEYVIKHKKLPTNWSDEDANQFVELAQEKIKLLAGSQE